ncbi:MAG: ribosome recycling factor [Lysobacterales bacterium]|jgi:ribosome recycling factor
MPAKQVIIDTEDKMKKVIESAKREFSEVRTGRAHPGLIEGLHIDYYGTATAFKELAAVSVPDPKTIVIQPWDPTIIPEIEKAIQTSSLGLTPQNDGKVVRLNIPALSQERREEMKKIVKDMAEKSRISVRTIRRDANDKIKKMQVDKEISEDDQHRTNDDIQKLTDRYIKDIEQLLNEKSKQLLEK